MGGWGPPVTEVNSVFDGNLDRFTIFVMDGVGGDPSSLGIVPAASVEEMKLFCRLVDFDSRRLARELDRQGLLSSLPTELYDTSKIIIDPSDRAEALRQIP